MACKRGNCTLVPFERNNYFYGKLMTVKDFRAEQKYFNDKRALLNRLIHGYGITCGLEVQLTGGSKKDAIDFGGNKVIYLSPGAALDCAGNEIIVSAAMNCLKVTGNFTYGDGTYFLYLKQRDYPSQKVPAHFHPSQCENPFEENCCESRISEGFEVILSKKILHENVGNGDCPFCDDPKVLLAVIEHKDDIITINKLETEEQRKNIYSNPQLYDYYNNLENKLEGHNGQLQTKLQNHIDNDNNPHKLKHDQTSPQGWDKVENRTGHISKNDAENWNNAVPRQFKVTIPNMSQGEKRKHPVKITDLDFNEAVKLGIEIRFSQKELKEKLEFIKNHYNLDDKLIEKWRKVMQQMIEKYGIGNIFEYYTGDTSLADFWVVVRSMTEGFSPSILQKFTTEVTEIINDDITVYLPKDVVANPPNKIKAFIPPNATGKQARALRVDIPKELIAYLPQNTAVYLPPEVIEKLPDDVISELGGLVDIKLEQIPGPSLAAKIDMRKDNLTLILRDNRKMAKDSNIKELVDYDVVFWLWGARTV